MVLLDALTESFFFLDFFEVSKCLDEVLPQGLDVWILFLKLVDADSIRNGFDESTCWASCDDVEWAQPEL